MPLPAGDSGVGHSFGLEFDGITIKAISEVTGLKMEQDVVEYKENGPDGKYQIRRLPGPPQGSRHYPDPRPHRRQSFENWIKDSRFGKMNNVRKGGAIIVFDFEGKAVKRYKLTNAWPKSLEIGSLKAGDTSYLSEKLVLTCESIEVETMRRSPSGRNASRTLSKNTSPAPRQDSSPTR